MDRKLTTHDLKFIGLVYLSFFNEEYRRFEDEIFVGSISTRSELQKYVDRYSELYKDKRHMFYVKEGLEYVPDKGGNNE
jgi:hypothetical protein